MTGDQMAERVWGVLVACRQEGVTDLSIIAHAVVYNLRMCEECEVSSGHAAGCSRARIGVGKGARAAPCPRCGEPNAGRGVAGHALICPVRPQAKEKP
jgi:hypothetical protein